MTAWAPGTERRVEMRAPSEKVTSKLGQPSSPSSMAETMTSQPSPEPHETTSMPAGTAMPSRIKAK